MQRLHLAAQRFAVEVSGSCYPSDEVQVRAAEVSRPLVAYLSPTLLILYLF